MRIAILSNSDIGLFKFRKELIEQLCEKHEVFIILPNGDYIEHLEKLGCCYIEFDFNRRGTNPFADIYQVNRYIKVLRKIKPNIVLTYTIKPNIYGGIACEHLGIPFISNVTGLGTTIENGGVLGFISTSLYKIGLRKSTCVFFQNSSNQELFIRKRIVKGKTRLIPGSGVNLDTYAMEPYPSESEGIRFLFVGRIMKDKGIEELLETIKTIHKEREDVTADIVGWCDEDYSKALRDAETEGAIKYHGLQSDILPFYQRCHCAVLPSYHEGTANVMLEASSTGRPIITTRVPGCRETFDEGITGFGCDARNSESLKKAMIKFLSINQKDREKMGLAARQKMIKEFDRKTVIAAYVEEIEAVSTK